MKKWILEKKLRKQLDFSLIVVSLIISIFGSINIYSATHVVSNYKYFTMQIIYITLSLMISYIFLLFDYSLIAKFSYILYGVGVILLLYTDIAAKATKGAQSWINIFGINIEPGEIIKIGLILIIAKLIDDMRGNVNNLKNLIKIFIYMCIPVAFILKEPNYGLAVICICIVFGMLFISGLNIWRILSIMLIFIGLCALMWQFNLLKTYQLTRITSFINPKNSSTDSTFQVDNSILAIGSGGLLGKGFLKSTQVSGGFIPEANTDMIFSVVGEEWGIVGAGVLLILYIIMLIKILQISKQSKDILGKLICVGYFSALTFSIYQNIGMTIRRAPVAGITLPFMSYGGSSILTNFIILALILNVGMRRKKINF